MVRVEDMMGKIQVAKEVVACFGIIQFNIFQ